MFEKNPYNCTKPGNLFFGYTDLRQDIIDGLFQTWSYAIIGGRRSGKTSILFQLLKDINDLQGTCLTNNKSNYYLIPRYLDVQSLNSPITVVSLFKEIYKLVISEFKEECNRSLFLWSRYHSNTICNDFIEQIESIKINIENKYGYNWIIVLLIDELDSACHKLNDMQFFENLRSILTSSSLSHHFCIVASGVKGMDNLIKGSSPLNILRIKFLNVLDEFSANNLIKSIFVNILPNYICDKVIRLSGKHPFLMQGLLEKIWDKAKKSNNLILDNIVHDFINEHRDFNNWINEFGNIEHDVYKCISDSYDQFISIDDIVNKLNSANEFNNKLSREEDIFSKIESALLVILSHGLIIQNQQNGKFGIAGTMFRDWYNKKFNINLITALNEDKNMEYMLPISGCHNIDRKADIVFVHGLDGDARATWHPKDCPDTFWPAWLGEDVPAVGVWSLGYAVSASAWKGHTMPLADRATNVLDRLDLDGIGRRPIVFVCHSLGGLLVKQVLRSASDFGNPAWKAIATQTKAIVFLSTPHSGADLASWIQHVGTLLRTTVSVEELEAHHPRLRELNLWYRNRVADFDLATVVYCEKRPVAGILVVDETSADPGIVGVVPIPVDEDHVSICKPTSKDSQIYRRVKCTVEEIIVPLINNQI